MTYTDWVNTRVTARKYVVVNMSDRLAGRVPELSGRPNWSPPRSSVFVVGYCLVALVCLVMFDSSAFASTTSGGLDRAFGRAGWTVTPPGTGGVSEYSVAEPAVAPDGSVFAGTAPSAKTAT